MRKIAVLQLTLTVAMVAAFGVIPGVAAKKRKEEGAGMTAVDENNGNDIVQDSDNRAAATSAAGSEYDDQRFSAVRYASEQPAAAESGGPTPVSAKAAAKQSSSKQHNAKLLNRLGMKRIRTSGGGGGGVQAGGNGGGGGGGVNHHRKRLASQSRSKYGSADGKSNSDSQMFIVKLPPHSHFYDDGSPAASHQRPQHQSPQHQSPHHHNNKQAPYKSLNTVPVGFVSNGKPAKVYHWNLPTIKHALQNGGGGGGRYKGVNDVAAMQQHHYQMQQQQQMHHQLQQFSQPNDFELPSVSAGSKIVPRRTLYYKPRASGKPVKKSFVNNGKPNGFYVVSSKNAAAAPQYHKIVKAYYGDD